MTVPAIFEAKAARPRARDEFGATASGEPRRLARQGVHLICSDFDGRVRSAFAMRLSVRSRWVTPGSPPSSDGIGLVRWVGLGHLTQERTLATAAKFGKIQHCSITPEALARSAQ